jgi:hypothetical protein
MYAVIISGVLLLLNQGLWRHYLNFAGTPGVSIPDDQVRHANAENMPPID